MTRLVAQPSTEEAPEEEKHVKEEVIMKEKEEVNYWLTPVKSDEFRTAEARAGEFNN